VTSLTCQQVLTSISGSSSVPLIHHPHNMTHGDRRRPRCALNTRTRKGMQRGTEKGKGRVYTVRLLFISFFLPLTNVLTSTTPPPLAEDEKPTIKGAFLVFGRSYDLPHPPEHEKHDPMSHFSCSGTSPSFPHTPNT